MGPNKGLQFLPFGLLCGLLVASWAPGGPQVASGCPPGHVFHDFGSPLHLFSCFSSECLQETQIEYGCSLFRWTANKKLVSAPPCISYSSVAASGSHPAHCPELVQLSGAAVHRLACSNIPFGTTPHSDVILNKICLQKLVTFIFLHVYIFYIEPTARRLE